MNHNYIWIEKLKNGLFWVDFIRSLPHRSLDNYTSTFDDMSAEEVGQIMGGN